MTEKDKKITIQDLKNTYSDDCFVILDIACSQAKKGDRMAFYKKHAGNLKIASKYLSQEISKRKINHE